MKATCHCNAVELAIELVDGLNTARRCDCSFCVRRGAVAVSVSLDDLKVVRGEDKLSHYSFNTHSAHHYFCSVCGIYTHHQRRSNPHQFGVNAANIEGVSVRDMGEIPWIDGQNHPKDAQT